LSGWDWFFEADLREPLPRLSHESFRFHPAFEVHHQVVGMTDDYDIALRDFLTSDFDPKVEHAVQPDVSQQRRNDSPNARDNMGPALIQ
jgi:hypothetical protein